MLLGSVFYVHLIMQNVCECTIFVEYFLCSVFRKQRGRLKICSESIVFDPLDFSHPVRKVVNVVRLYVNNVCMYE